MDCAIQLGWIEFDRLRDLAQTAEELGFSTVYFPDHLLAEGPERQAMGLPSFDPMMQAAVVASVTSRIRIGHLVLCNLFRHPAVTARSLATLDQMSGGRMVAGLGSGWTETEFRMTGIPFPEIGERLRMLDEALTCIRGLWGREPFSFEGEFYKFQAADLSPRPVQDRPPIVLGGSGKGLLRIAAKHADVVNIVAETGRAGYIALANAIKLSSDTFRDKVRFLRAEAARAGRDGNAIRISAVLFTVHLTESRAAGEAMIESLAGMFGVPPKALGASPLFLVGTPEDCIAELRRRQREWEVSEFVVSGMNNVPDLLERFGREVMPHV
jgi:probable F420-dependent oxidoreductase